MNKTKTLNKQTKTLVVWEEEYTNFDYVELCLFKTKLDEDKRYEI